METRSVLLMTLAIHMVADRFDRGENRLRRLSLVHVEDDSASDFAVVHVVVDLGEVRSWQRLVQTLDLAGCCKGQSLRGVLSVSDVRADDSLGQEDRPEDGDLNVAVGRESNGNTPC